MNPIRFFVEGDPKAQPRPRAFARMMGGKPVARVYDAGTAEGWKSAIAVAAQKYRPNVPYDGPLMLTAVFSFMRPKSHWRKNGLARDAAIYHTQKPDLDNLVKAVKDALTTLGFWRDDSQVVCERLDKCWCTERPGARIGIEPYTITADDLSPGSDSLGE